MMVRRLLLQLPLLFTACTSDPVAFHNGALEFTPLQVSEAEVGEAVTFALEVKNSSDSAVSLGLPHGEFSFDPIVTRVGSDEAVWRSWNGVVVDVMRTSISIRPQGTHTFTATWNGTDTGGNLVQPGEYRVHYSLVVEPQLTVVGASEFTLTLREE